MYADFTPLFSPTDPYTKSEQDVNGSPVGGDGGGWGWVGEEYSC